MHAPGPPLFDAVAPPCDLKLARTLLERGTQVNSVHPGFLSYSPIHIASNDGSEEQGLACELLLSHRADPNIRTPHAFGSVTPLIIACRGACWPALHALLKWHADPNVCSTDPNTSSPLGHVALSDSDGADAAALALITARANVNMSDNGPSKMTSLHLAAGRRNVSIVTTLLQHNADVDFESQRGITALVCAIPVIGDNGGISVGQRGRGRSAAAVCEVLLENLADILHGHERGISPYFYGCNSPDGAVRAVILCASEKMNVPPDELELRHLDSSPTPPFYWSSKGLPVSSQRVEPGFAQCIMDLSFKRVDGTYVLSLVRAAGPQTRMNFSTPALSTRDRHSPAPLRFHVHAVLQVENKVLWHRYCRKRSELARKSASTTPLSPASKISECLLLSGSLGGHELCGEATEILAFHGSSHAACEGIQGGGFNIDMSGSCTGAAFGKGAYFAESSTKADEYTEAAPGDVRPGRGETMRDGSCVMLLCRISMGCIHTTSDFDRHGHETARAHGCDSILGDRERHSGSYREFIVFDSAQIYPQWLIFYKRINT